MPAHEPYRFEFWRLDEGLPQITVNALAQDAQGFLWVGTEEGLARFDGLHFEVYDRANTPELGSNSIRNLLLDRHGDLWIGTRRGLTRYADGRFHTAAPVSDEPSFMPNPLRGEIRDLYQDTGGTLWIATSQGLLRYQDGAFSPVPLGLTSTEPSISSIHRDQQGSLWIGTEFGLLRLVDPLLDPLSGKVEVFEVSHGLPHPQVQAIFQDRSDRLWVATLGGWGQFHPGTAPFAPGSSDAKLVPFDQTHGKMQIDAFFEDREGRLWVGSDLGLFRIDGDTLIDYPEFEANLLESGARSFWQDHEGNLWIGTGILGLASLRRQSVKVFDASQGLIDNLAWSVLQDPSGSVWIGSNRGLTRIDSEGEIRHWTTEDGLPGEDVRALALGSAGRLWLGTDSGGLAHIDRNRLRIELDHDLGAPAITSLLEDRRGRLWIGTTKGLLLQEGEERRVVTTQQGLHQPQILTLYEGDHGQIWIGTDAGLALWQDDRIQVVEPLLAQDEVKAMHQDAIGTLWIGTADGGLVRRPANPNEPPTRYTVEHGLADSLVHQILEAPQGWLWLSSNRGVFRLLKKELEDFAAGRIPRIRPIPFTETDGMGSRECNGMGHPAGTTTADGRIWFPTIRGVSIFDPAQLSERWSPIPAFIDRVVVDRRPLEHLPAGEHQAVKLEPGTREIEIHYRAVSFLDAERTGYRYRLEGFDPNWIDPGRARSAKYTYLPPGHYRFRVAAANPGGIWTESGDSIEFHLAPTIYQTWTFYLVSALVAFGLGLVFYRLRLRNLLQKDRLRIIEAKNQEIEQLTYNVCHDLKSPVLTIQGFTNLLEEDLADDDHEAVARDLRRIRGATDQISGLLDELLVFSQTGRVTLRSDPLNLSLLAREAADLVAGQAHERGVTIDIPPGLPAVVGDHSHLLRLFQNLFDNAIKFMANQTTPTIEVGAVAQGDEVLCWIRDNGIGIDEEDQKKIFRLFHRVHEHASGSGIGLALVSRIVKAHGGRIWVESEGREQGSTFFFTLPSPSGSLD